MGSKCIFYSMNCTTVEGGRWENLKPKPTWNWRVI
jgi:hypothetical protein